MKTLKILALTALVTIGLSSCSNDDDRDTTPEVGNSDSGTVKITNLEAKQTSDYTTNPPTIAGDFVKFDFSSGATTTSDTDWDIAFRGTTILVNGGTSSGLTSEPNRTGNAAAYITNSTFDDVKTVTTASFAQDSSSGFAIPTGSGNGWYTYDMTTHLITPTAGKILVFRTADDKYAKVEILSYYKDSNTSSEGQFYTFNYVYQGNGSTTF